MSNGTHNGQVESFGLCSAAPLLSVGRSATPNSLATKNLTGQRLVIGPPSPISLLSSLPFPIGNLFGNSIKFKFWRHGGAIRGMA